VISLPFARLAAGVHRRRLLLVNRSTLSIEISRVVIRIEDLDFIATHQINPAVATALPAPFYFRRRRKFHMQLAITEFFLRRNRAARVVTPPTLVFPLAPFFPSSERFSVKQPNRVARPPARWSRIDHRWLRPNDAAFIFDYLHCDQRPTRQQHQRRHR